MKVKTTWHCASCGQKHVKWQGQCTTCREWNTLTEELEPQEKTSRHTPLLKAKKTPVRLSEIQEESQIRISTELTELDRILGGGIVPGSLCLIGGEPGIGKSTLSLQLAAGICKKGRKVLYVSGEESLEQISLRAKRLNIQSDNLLFFNDTEVSSITSQIEQLKPDLVIVDSIQIVYREELSSSPGSVTQIRESTASFLQVAKQLNAAIFIVGHVTKSGDIAGPKILEHLVDTVLYFDGDKQLHFRLLRVIKNRFGPTDEVAVFQMDSDGLKQIRNPSQLFLEERSQGASGSVIIPSLEGSSSILIEVQALVTKTFYPNPSRKSTGLDPNRLALLLAVLEKRSKLPLHQCDVFVSVTGGFRIQEPAADLGILLSIASSFCNKPFCSKTFVAGEVGLAGEIRAIRRLESRIKEGIQMGFSRCIVPKRNLKGLHKSFHDKIQITGVEWTEEVIDEIMR